MRLGATAWALVLLLAGCGGEGAGSSNAGARSECGEDTAALVFTRGIGAELDVYTADANGGDITRLTRRLGVDTAPTWSPDGCRIAFVSRRGADGGLFLMNADGSDVERVDIAPQRGVDEPAWSPRGDAIAFEDAFGVVLSVDPDRGRASRVSPRDFFASTPTWSPDGRRIAFAGLPRNELPGGRGRVVRDVFVVDAEGGEPQRLTDTPDVDETGLSWSPDGRWIAFFDQAAPHPATQAPGSSADRRGIFIVASDGGAARRVTSGPDLDPTWSPDSRSIAFTRTEGYSEGSVGEPLHSLFVRPLDGGAERKIVAAPPATLNADWSGAAER